LQRSIQVGNLLGDEIELIGGLIAGQYAAMPIENETARGGNGLDTDPVTLRELRIVVLPEDL
jgi:hypothetical protein